MLLLSSPLRQLVLKMEFRDIVLNILKVVKNFRLLVAKKKGKEKKENETIK